MVHWQELPRQSLRLHRLRRLAASGSPVLFAGAIALAGLAISASRRMSIWTLLSFGCFWPR